jgi:hypothetical protein
MTGHSCDECGAPLAATESCRDRFHALLALEQEMVGSGEPGDALTAAHFHAVSSYILQHPRGMEMTATSLRDLRVQLGRQLSGAVHLRQILAGTRAAAAGSARVTRRAADPVPAWPVPRWPVTIHDALDGGAAGYAQRVRGWAVSVAATLDVEAPL